MLENNTARLGRLMLRGRDTSLTHPTPHRHRRNRHVSMSTFQPIFRYGLFHSWVSIRHYAVNLGGGQPQKY